MCNEFASKICKEHLLAGLNVYTYCCGEIPLCTSNVHFRFNLFELVTISANKIAKSGNKYLLNKKQQFFRPWISQKFWYHPFSSSSVVQANYFHFVTVIITSPDVTVILIQHWTTVTWIVRLVFKQRETFVGNIPQTNLTHPTNRYDIGRVPVRNKNDTKNGESVSEPVL